MQSLLKKNVQVAAMCTLARFNIFIRMTQAQSALVLGAFGVIERISRG